MVVDCCCDIVFVSLLVTCFLWLFRGFLWRVCGNEMHPTEILVSTAHSGPDSETLRFRNITAVLINEKKRSFDVLCFEIIVNVLN